MATRYQISDMVFLPADPSRRGPVLKVLPDLNGMPRYQVFLTPTSKPIYAEDQLEPVPDQLGVDDLASVLSSGEWLDVSAFRARLTAARLANPQVDSLYALHAARISFIPFQFKPLVRLLQVDAPRLLVADEVGVGKTIEAGLILKELSARQTMDNVLIVCPKALVEKWRAEMRRFDEDFRVLTAGNLHYCLREAHNDGAWPVEWARAIAPPELLRQEEYMDAPNTRDARPTLRTLNPAPHFSLVVVDEAHHLRNPETRSHALASFLCDVADAVVFLSATPVHTGAVNLFTLLHLFRPELFPDRDVFAAIIEPNQFLTAAMRHVRTRQPEGAWGAAALLALRSAAATGYGQHVLLRDRRFTEWLERLESGAQLSDADRVRCLRALEEVHTLAHVVSRTRRRDIGRFTIREPHTIEAPFTPAQVAFYAELIEFRRQALLQRHNPLVVCLILDTLERQAASCLPALAAAIDDFLSEDRMHYAAVSDTDIEEIEVSEGQPIPAFTRQHATRLATIARTLPSEDPKRDKLLEIVTAAQDSAGSGKVLIFSFFLHTLAYLERTLHKAGVRVAVVNGNVEEEERARLRDRFRLPRTHPDAIDVLLSSEVGCEGLDYEFCDRLVNYDLPWNPMRIEQRIGRIDRFGQRSDKVLIYNFITPGTVEERIYHRCFERLGLFRDTIGDLEEVLGDLSTELNRLALDPALTPEQAEIRARQAADNVVHRLEEQRRLEDQSGDLLGLDPNMAGELDAADALGRFVTADDLQRMVGEFVALPNLKGRLERDQQQPGLCRLVLAREGRDLLLGRLPKAHQRDRPTREFARWLQANIPSWSLTFDQETALERRDVPFITPIHPLAKLAAAALRPVEAPWQRTFRCATPICPPDATSLPATSGKQWEYKPRGGCMAWCGTWMPTALMSVSPNACLRSRRGRKHEPRQMERKEHTRRWPR